MLKTLLSFCVLCAASILIAATPSNPDSIQARFDKLAARKAFGETECAELRAIMEAEKESPVKADCTFCPDALTWRLAEKGFFEEADWLFDRNADFGIKDKDGMTLLQMACRGGHRQFAERLIGRGAEINLPDQEGRTAIHYAVMSGNSELVKTLLDLGSDPNKLTKKKDTPLHFAAKYSGLEEVQFLMEHGASIKAINWTLVENLKDQRYRQDKLYYDSDEEHIAALKTALGLKTPESMQSDDEEDEETDEDDEDDGGERYADVADEEDESLRKKNGKKDQITVDPNHIPFYLLPRDINDAANTDGITVLHCAAENGDTEVVRFLIEHGADISAEDIVLSRSAIHFAAENGNLDCIKYLTEKEANLLDQDIYGATALDYAARSGHLEAVKYLVDKKIDYTVKDSRGWTVMHYAACGGNVDIIKYLLAKGLSINARTKSGRTPLFFAKDPELRRFMVSKGAK